MLLRLKTTAASEHPLRFPSSQTVIGRGDTSPWPDAVRRSRNPTAEGAMSRYRLAGLLTFVSIGILAGCSDRSPTNPKPSFLGLPNLPGVPNPPVGAPPVLSAVAAPGARAQLKPLVTDAIIPCVGGETVLLIQDAVPWGFAVPADQDPLGADVTELKAQDKNFCMIHSADIGTTDLSQFSEILIPSDQNQEYYDNLFPGFPVGVIHKAIVNWVIAGGILSANLTDHGFNGGLWTGKVFVGGVQHVVYFSDINDILDPDHPIIEDDLPCGSNGHCGPIVDAGFQHDLDGWNSSSHGYFTTLCPATKVILINELGEPVMIEYGFGAGKVVANLNTLEWRYYGPGGVTPEKKLLANEIAYQDAIACDGV